MDTLIFLNHFRRSPLFLFCPSSSDKEKNVGKKKLWKPTTFYYLISGKPLVSTGNLAYVLQTSFTGLFLGGDTMSAKNLVSQLSLPEQFLLFLFTFSWNWSLPASTCSWEAPYSSGSSTFQQPCEWPRTSQHSASSEAATLLAALLPTFTQCGLCREQPLSLWTLTHLCLAQLQPYSQTNHIS